MIFRRAFNIPVPGLIFSIIGLLYSIFMSVGVGTEVVCLTSGCALVDDFRLFGISPWWAAAVIFGLMTVLSIFRFRALAHYLALLMLLGDMLFMLVMIFLAPCTSCLIAAVLIFCTWVALRSRPAMLVTPRRILAGGIGAVWVLLFLLNLGPVLYELPSPMVMQARPEAKVSIYFSPSCPACFDAVRVFGDDARFYPVAEKEGDIGMIVDIQERMESGQSFRLAMMEVYELSEADGYVPPEIGLWRGISLSIALLRNQAALGGQGFAALPVIMFEGMPRSWTGGADRGELGQASGAASSGTASGSGQAAVGGSAPTGQSGGSVVLEGVFIPWEMLKGLEELKATLQDRVDGKPDGVSAGNAGGGEGVGLTRGVDESASAGGGSAGDPDEAGRKVDSSVESFGTEPSDSTPYRPGERSESPVGDAPRESVEELTPVSETAGASVEPVAEAARSLEAGQPPITDSLRGQEPEDEPVAAAVPPVVRELGAREGLSAAELPPDLQDGTFECGQNAPEPCD